MVHPSKPGVCSRRKIRAPPSTSGSISKSSSQTPRSRRCLGRRVTKRSVGSRMCPSAETTKGLSAMCCAFRRCTVRQNPRRVREAAHERRPTGRYTTRRRDAGRSGNVAQAVEAAPGRLDLGRLGRRRRTGPDQPGHPEKVLEGIREVEAGISFCLSLPLDYPGGTALNQRRHPPVVAPTEDMEGEPATFYNVHMSEMDGLRRSQVRRRLGRRRGHALAAVLDAVGLARPRRCRVRRRRRRGRGGRLLQRLPRRRRPGRPVRRRPRRRGPPPRLRPPPGLEHMAFHGVQGRGVLVDLAHHLGDEWRASTARRSRRSWRPTAWWSSPATSSCCTPGSPPGCSSGSATPIP